MTIGWQEALVFGIVAVAAGWLVRYRARKLVVAQGAPRAMVIAAERLGLIEQVSAHKRGRHARIFRVRLPTSAGSGADSA